MKTMSYGRSQKYYSGQTLLFFLVQYGGGKQIVFINGCLNDSVGSRIVLLLWPSSLLKKSRNAKQVSFFSDKIGEGKKFWKLKSKISDGLAFKYLKNSASIGNTPAKLKMNRSNRMRMRSWNSIG